MRSTSSSRWMADASRLRRRSRSASDSAGVDVEDSAGVLEAEGSLDIARVGRRSIESSLSANCWSLVLRPTCSFVSWLRLRALAAMTINLHTLTRSLRTNTYPLYRTRFSLNNVHLSRTAPLSDLMNPCRLLHLRLDIPNPPRPFWTNNTGPSRGLSTHAHARPPSSKHPRARLVSARELYAQRNRSLFMYTSAVVRASLHPPSVCLSSLLQ
jgi:hypothetical protein